MSKSDYYTIKLQLQDLLGFILTGLLIRAIAKVRSELLDQQNDYRRHTDKDI